MSMRHNSTKLVAVLLSIICVSALVSIPRTARALDCPTGFTATVASNLQANQVACLPSDPMALSTGITVFTQQPDGSLAVQQDVNQGTGKPNVGSCSLTSFSFNDCIWIPLMSWLGSWFLTIGGALLRLAGTMFDALIQSVIINFKTTLDTLQITSAVNTGWTVFRDFSNILIIGMFVFIAIGIILGLKEFGQKKLVANVLVIAVLINFSLLFTEMIIDGSNLVAYQVYGQMAGSGQLSNGNFDIAQSFLSPMGITSVWSDTSLVTKGVAQTTGSAMQAFFFGLVGGMLLIAVAAVLFYGCFLIATRAILFIFLMLTASLAFATYLIPSLAKGQYGWSTWWKSLINNAVFAPLLMLFLAVSLTIVKQAGAYKLAQTTGTGADSGTLGAIIANPQTLVSNANNGWTAILIYIIGIGLLYASIKVSSSFASSISGFNFTGLLLPRLAVGAFATGSRMAAPFGRNILGRGAASQSKVLEQQIAAETASLAKAKAQNPRQMQDLSKLTAFMKQKDKADARAKSDYNLMNTDAAKALTSRLGLGGVLSGGAKKVGGYVGPRKEAADEAAKKAVSVALSESSAITAAKEEKMGDQQHRDQLASIQAQKETAQNNKRAVDQIAKGSQTQLTQLRDQMAKASENLKAETTKGADVEQRVKTGRGSAVEFQEQTERIKSAHQAVNDLQSQIHTIEKPVRDADEQVAAAEKQLDAFNKKTEGAIRSRAKEIRDASAGIAGDVAAELAHGDAYTVAEARSLTKKRVGVSSLLAQKKAEREALDSAGIPAEETK
jgi:predicted  nucleic acid-binding Zn-ribbon protein